MKRTVFLLLGLAVAGCSAQVETPSGQSVPDLGWLFTGKGPYVLETKVDAAPGPAAFQLVKDLSLMAETPDVVLSTEVSVGEDSTVRVKLGKLAPGFYQVRLNDTVRFNIGVRPDAVVSVPDARPDFDAFWEQTLTELAEVPIDPTYTLMPDYSNDARTCYEVRYPSWNGGVSGGVISIPNGEGKYPVHIQFMGYGADVYPFDPDAAPDRIDFLVSVRDQGIFKNGQDRWIDRGLSSKETFYYRGAFADARRAVDFAVSLDKADPERIVAYGESQGGALTVVAAALDDRIKAIAPAVPFLGDYPDYGKIVWWPVHEVLEAADAEGLTDRDALYGMLSYFDVKNFAPRVKCPAYMAFGLQDPTCPPHTNFSIYNNIASEDKEWFCVPTCGHAMWQESSWSTTRAAWLEEQIPQEEIVMVVETTMGNVEFKLYNETPRHRDNFLKLAQEHYFDSLLFHRVIDNFVIQGGDPNSKYAGPGKMLGDGEPDYRVPAEFRLDKGIFHRKGVVNAAREGDDTNPDRESCASQFCFMMGSPMTDEQIDRAQARVDAATGGQVKITPEMREVYKKVGGSPHLDGQYTVFGEVVSGMDVLEAIQKVETDEYDRPLTDVRMLRVYRK